MSLRRAINEKCKDCIYDHLSPGTWRKQVEECTIQTCSLWPVRPKAAVSRKVAKLSVEQHLDDIVERNRPLLERLAER